MNPPHKATRVNICQYKVKPGQEKEMERLLALHWPTLHKAGLATDDQNSETFQIIQTIEGQVQDYH